MLAARTIATSDRSSLAAKIQLLPFPTIRDSRLALLKLCLYKGQIKKILRNLSNQLLKDVVTFLGIPNCGSLEEKGRILHAEMENSKVGPTERIRLR